MQELIGKAAEGAKRVMSNVDAAQYENRTPCEEFNVKQLGNHMAGLAAMSANAAQRKPMSPPPDPALDLIGNDPGTNYAPLADAAARDWSSASLEGNVEFGPGEMPAQFAASITLMEMSVHAWDMARATGQEFQMSDDVAAAVFEVVKQTATPESRERGSFGAQVEVGANASLQDQLLAYSGRDPNWTA